MSYVFVLAREYHFEGHRSLCSFTILTRINLIFPLESNNFLKLLCPIHAGSTGQAGADRYR